MIDMRYDLEDTISNYTFWLYSARGCVTFNLVSKSLCLSSYQITSKLVASSNRTASANMSTV
jgi:hypothetical protein